MESSPASPAAADSTHLTEASPEPLPEHPSEPSPDPAKDAEMPMETAAEIISPSPEQAEIPPPLPVEASLELSSYVHYAHLIVGLPLLQAIRLRNYGDEDLLDLSLDISTTPAFFAPTQLRLDRIEAGALRLLKDLPLKPDLDRLAAGRERCPATLHLTLHTAGRESLEWTGDLQILAYNEWPGLHHFPDSLAAFVTPNVPTIQEILHHASEKLRLSTGNSGIDGYLSKDPVRVWRMAEAVFLAVADRRIHYIHPPASYESGGQKVRFPEEVWTSRQGACLDLSLLLASALEAAGLRPWLLIEKNHAYAGCWLKPLRIADSIEDDAQTLRKHVDLGDLLVFESTLLTSEGATFAEATARGRAHLDKSSSLQLAIDLHLARRRGILPLPLRIEEGRLFIAPPPTPETDDPAGRFTSDDELAYRLRDAEATKPPFPQPSDSTAADSPEADPLPPPAPPAARIERWRLQLLDLSLRNRLLNFSPKRSIQMIVADPAALEDELFANLEMRLLPRPAASPSTIAGQKAEAPDAPGARETFAADLAERRLRADLPENELTRRLTNLEREARLALEEGGSNTLFLALGVLAWKIPGENREHLAPLLLMPVSLARRSVRSGFRLRRLEEETRTNVTLLEKLRREFQLEIPGVDPPPEDDKGINVALFLRRFRKAVKEVPGLEVRPQVFLGPFSFSKFLLWKDLEERLDDLRRNPVVNHLVEHWGTAFDQPGEDLHPHELDDKLPPEETFCVLEADSSQLAAVANAARGRHFVLFGPPGTGKSQTITNIIAQSLALGKTVLFVAEKRAALDVVQSRLERCGLGPFCLELHSNKTGKTAFIQQLRDAVELPACAAPAEWEREARRLRELRDSLNQFVRNLHRPLPNGISAYAAYARLIARMPPEAADTVPAALPELHFPEISAHTPETRREMREALQRYLLRLKDFPRPAEHPLAPITVASYSLTWERSLTSAIDTLLGACDGLRESLEAPRRHLKLPETPPSHGWLLNLQAFAEHLLQAPAAGLPFFNEPWSEDKTRTVRQWLQALADERQQRAALENFDPSALLALDVGTLRKNWMDIENGFAPLRWLKRPQVLKPLEAARRSGTKLRPAEVEPLLHRIETFARARAAAEAANAAAAPLLGPLWNNGTPDPAQIEAALNWIRQLASFWPALCGEDFSAVAALRQHIAHLLTEGRPWLAPGQSVHQALTVFRQQFAQTMTAWKDLCTLAGIQSTARHSSPDWVEALSILAKGIQQHRAQWQRWCNFNELRQTTHALALAPLTRLVESGQIPPDQTLETFSDAYARATLAHILDQQTGLRDFFSDLHEEQTGRFRETDAALTRLTRTYVRATVAAARPEGLADAKAFGEIGILHAELARKTRFKPIRQLIAQIPNILPTLKPCFLMSPLSVAQYLDAAHPPFDLVIFDEASQIPVCDAIGALARGWQCIVAGDPRQLPPTSFFEKARSPDDEPVAETDDDSLPLPDEQESILDECLSARVPEHRLQWHYRSKHESLIAFSNHHIYDGRLLTFPEPWAQERGVRLHPVPNGLYDRGRTRANRPEAEAVVQAVRQHFLQPRQTRSLGVITFNSEQQSLINNLIDAARAAEPAFDEALAAQTGEDCPEPFFVWNLENVQGQERDVIFFSITFGPDASGVVSHNFGPLNLPGGHRRLNVAITRARLENHIFSTLRDDQIQLSRTRAEGARLLREYLAYARLGRSSLPQAETISGPAQVAQPDLLAERPFVEHIARFLRSAGHTVRTGVGTSTYRLDLAVVHPDDPERFLAAIECDGPAYASAATARDRERLRPGFLQSLGWNLLRTWSTDWFRDPAAEQQRILHELQRLQTENPPPPTTENQPHNESSAPASTNPQNGSGQDSSSSSSSSSSNGQPPAKLKSTHSGEAADSGAKAADSDAKAADSDAKTADSDAKAADSGAKSASLLANTDGLDGKSDSLLADTVDLDGNSAEPGGDAGGPGEDAGQSDESRRSKASEPPNSPFGNIEQFSPFTPSEPCPLNAQNFFHPANQVFVQNLLAGILEAEAPISEPQLAQRLRKICQLPRADQKLLDYLRQNLPDQTTQDTVGELIFYGRPGQPPAHFDRFRSCTATDPERRPLDHIHPTERTAAMRWLHQRYPGIDQENLLRQTALIFGFPALTPKTRQILLPQLTP